MADRSEEMKAMYDLWKESGLSAKAFARQVEMPYTSFKYWQNRIEGKTRAKSKARFIEYKEEPKAQKQKSDFEVRFSKNLSLSVPADFDSSALRRLVEVLKAC